MRGSMHMFTLYEKCHEIVPNISKCRLRNTTRLISSNGTDRHKCARVSECSTVTNGVSNIKEIFGNPSPCQTVDAESHSHFLPRISGMSSPFTTVDLNVDSNKMLTSKRRTMFRPLPRRYRLYVIIPGISIMCLYLLIGPAAAPGSPSIDSSHSSRHLLSATTTATLPNSTTSPTPLWGMCVDGSSGEYPPDLFTCEQKRNGAIVLHCIGLVYMFIALAIVCDEFFVPSLQVIIDYLHISEDVAGATFMAAGGSAPELATSFIGTFLAKSSVGIGTIVGSAVFNILFVIAMCAFFSTGVLKLTWWPLFRDVCFYSAALIMLIGFFYDSQIMWWESIILFVWYIAYVVFMGFNPKVEKVVKSACCCSADIMHISEVQGGKVSASHEELVSDYPPSELRRAPPVGGPGGKRSPASGASEHDLQDEEKERDGKAKRNSQGTQRSSSYPIIRSASGKYRRSVFNMVTQKTVDGSIDQSTVPEEQQMGTKSGTAPPKYPFNREDTPDSAKVKSSQQTTVTMVDSSVCSLDKMVEELATKKRWKAGAQEDENGSAHPTNGDLGTGAHPEELRENSEETTKPRRTHVRFSRVASISVELRPASLASVQLEDRSRKGDSEDDDDDDEDKPLDMSWPDGAWKRITYVICFPLVGLLWLTLFDVRKENRRKFFVWTFIGSIMWIGGYSFLMNWWAKMIGEIIGIPDEVMGLTFLAAGTSIPDLLTSVIVAKKGFGDMAVSSSVGSNLFDVTVGLPIPWFFWSCSQSMAAVQVTSKGMFCSILLLFGMLLAVIASIAAFKWQMSKGLGAAMMVLYVVFLSVSVLMFYDIIPCILSHSS